ncbi:MAG: GxxExxY protein [Chloroflexaceae bacterium]|nr:GxxExxY protein [Chloroflexaceae bacterium]
MIDLLHKEEVFAIIGAAIEVHKELGTGFLEAVYQEALEIEMMARGIPFISQHELRILYKGRYLDKFYIADFFVFDAIVVEIKALKALTILEDAQLINQLKATNANLGVLINFGSQGKLEWKRMVRTR